MKPRQTAVVVAAALAFPVAGLAACGSDEPKSAAPSRAAARDALTGSPPELRRLHRQANRLLGGGADAFRARLRQLRGHPVVVNKWASWCPPCRAEFPFFQTQAIERGKQIAFLGVDAQDVDEDAEQFLKELPVSYPSYRDPELKVSAVFNGDFAFPTTAFYDSRGRLAFVHQGEYATERKLVEDIERYAR